MGGPVEARWRLLPQDPRRGAELAAALGVLPVTAQALLNRGLRTAEAARVFLSPSLSQLTPPLVIGQMARVVERMVRAIRARTSIVVYGDYDADGVTSTAILVRALRRAGAPVDFYVPGRQTEGYGLHADAVRRLATSGARLIIAVDCGITAVEAAGAAQEAGADLLILDHHLPLGPIPAAHAVVNPHISGEPTDYCAAGLALQAARGLWEALGCGEDDPDALGLAALGTVADAVPLRGDNRTIVTAGLQRLSSSGTPGVRSLIEVAGIRSPLVVRDLSHGLAPRLNAAGRLSHAAEAVRLLVADDPADARHIAEGLDRLNTERRALCDQVLVDALEDIERSGAANRPAIVLAREGWHPGVVGIVASQIVERYYRPTVLIAIRQGTGKGSGRSIPALHLVDALSAVETSLVAYGGHAMAAGLTLPAEAVPEFREAFIDEVAGRLSAGDLQPVVDVDAEVSLDAVTPELADECARLGPFGSGNAAPVLLTRGLRAVGARTVGGGAHLRLVVSDGTRSADAIGFRLGDRAELLAFTQARLDLAYSVERDQWREHGAVQLVVDQLWTPEVDQGAVTADTGHLLARLFGRADDYLDAERIEIEDLPAFHTKVVGVTFEGRQATLAQAKTGERLRLTRDPSNPRDPHAIKVCLADGREIGFLRAALAARLAPAIDAGARYAATATALTGGGDRAWGLNIYVERQAAWSGDSGIGEPGARPPLGPGFLGWVTARLTRGRVLPLVQREILGVLLAGGRAAVRHGPGRGLLAAVAAAAAALLAIGRRPVLLVLPRAVEVEAWNGVLQPWLRGAGLQIVAAHGALPARARFRVLEATERRAADVVVASAAWTMARTPPAAAVIVIADDVCLESDLTALRDYYGDRVRLVSGPGSLERLRRAAGPAGLAPVGSRLDPRVNLRVVDHRGREGRDGFGSSGGHRPEKLLVVAANAAACVAEARRRRESDGEAARHIAYYHDRLPAALRRVLEDLYSAGQITSLVAGSLLVHPAVPLDVSRVEVTGLPATRLLAAESLSTAGQGGQTAIVDLRFGLDSVGVWAAALEARQPSRDSLVRCYQYFKGLGHGGAWAWRPGGPSVELAGVPAELVPVALEIFLEAGVVSAEGGEGDLARYTLVDPSARVDLDRSLRYQEAARERAAFADLRAWATGPASAILAELAQP